MFGIMYLRGALHLNGVDCDIAFYHESSNEILQSTMSRKRFQFLSKIMQFDDCGTRPDRWKQDKFACLRDFFESINEMFVKLRVPSEHLAIDETLYPYRGRIGFRQYNPNKPAKYGLLFRSLCDSSLQYTYYSLPYGGKPSEPGSKFYVTGTDNYTIYLVENTIQIGGKTVLRGKNISLDRYFTSLSIAEWLQERNISVTGTLRKDRIGLPQEMKTEAGRTEKSTKWCYNGNMMLVSYADKKKKGTKVVLLLSTMHDEIHVSRDERTKPSLIVYYDHMKGGVDVMDLCSTMLTTRSKTPRWALNATFFLLDIVRTNSRTLFNEIKNSKLSNFEYTWNLGKELVMPFIQQRYQANDGIQSSLKEKMRRILGVGIVQNPIVPVQNAGHGICEQCRNQIQGEGYAAAKKKLNNKITEKCFQCGHFVCSKPMHRHSLCIVCKSAH